MARFLIAETQNGAISTPQFESEGQSEKGDKL